MTPQLEREIEAALINFATSEKPWREAADTCLRPLFERLVNSVEKLQARVLELEGAMFLAGRFYGFESSDGLPCWCEPGSRTDLHSDRCLELRGVLTGSGNASSSAQEPTCCGHCDYEEADGSLIEQCGRCKSIDKARGAQ